MKPDIAVITWEFGVYLVGKCTIKSNIEVYLDRLLHIRVETSRRNVEIFRVVGIVFSIMKKIVVSLGVAFDGSWEVLVGSGDNIGRIINDIHFC